MDSLTVYWQLRGNVKAVLISSTKTLRVLLTISLWRSNCALLASTIPLVTSDYDYNSRYDQMLIFPTLRRHTIYSPSIERLQVSHSSMSLRKVVVIHISLRVVVNLV